MVGQSLSPGLPQALLLRLCISLGQAGQEDKGSGDMKGASPPKERATSLDESGPLSQYHPLSTQNH